MSAEGSAVPVSSKGSWAQFLKSVSTFNGDLSTLTAPPFIVSSTSLTEFSSYWAEHPNLFIAPAKESDPATRAMLVLKWFLATLKSQYSSRSDKLGSEKKPLNPFLGELFLGEWEGDVEDEEAGETKLVSEQVSHHPPVTAYCIWNSKNGVRLEGYNGQKASFKSTINVKQVGHAVYNLEKFNETYVITLPSLHIEGLISGSPFVELNKSSTIISSSGYVATISYSGRGWLSGKKNSISATLHQYANPTQPASYDPSAPGCSPKSPLYTADGQWNSTFNIKAASGEVISTFDASQHPITPLSVTPVEQQDPLETRRAWKKVADAVAKGDMDLTSWEKSKIENAQRELRKKEKEEGREWRRRFFSQTDRKDEKVKVIAALLGHLHENIEADKTGGIWVWDADKAKDAQPPFAGSEELGKQAVGLDT
ncbi:Oxysterol-binding protein [Eremomyces bilateralis CBS 781.70]|uniref:Oxysterol-binding protein n=1 Tax=Eremomyces bilateralis CBS 781.70 TaxID=1392243 RepID=A0A6G1G537_9PEZI|nr:Oxysterol-binding protein [Eremomyces bilateralis CBS 781.70]KAF1813020.1 Oxysterol-binding protein [Eremomyces bilateralis CBS 781.70]